MPNATAEEKLKKKKAIKKLPLLVQGQILEEIKHNPKFRYFIEDLIKVADPHAAVLVSQRKAILNELNPANHPETMGLWQKLRCHVRAQKDLYIRKATRPGGIGQPAEKIEGNYGEQALKERGITQKGIDTAQIEKRSQEKAAEKRIADAKRPKIDVLKTWGYLGIPMGIIAFIRGLYDEKKR